MTVIVILALMYITGFLLSTAYVLKLDHKRLLITNSIVLAVSVALLASSLLAYEGYDRLGAFLIGCGGIFMYFLLVSVITLIVGVVKRSSVLISSSITGLLLCLILFMVLRNMWPE